MIKPRAKTSNSKVNRDSNLGAKKLGIKVHIMIKLFLKKNFILKVLHSYAYWLTSKQSLFVWLSAASILIFRSELAIISGIMLLIALAKKQLSFATLILNGIEATVIFVGLSVFVDSYFWDYWVWPEGQVFWFNTILNKSSEWGINNFQFFFLKFLNQ